MTYPGSDHDEAARALLFPEDHVNPRPQQRYHLVVIGAGPAGLIAAIGAAGLGAKVALVERQMMGGDCLNVGCVPSKALLEYSEHCGSKADFAGAFAWLREVRAGIAPHDSVERYTELGVDVFLGEAQFDARGQVTVAGTGLNARRIAICTGAQAAVPPIPGLREAQPLTNESVFDLVEQPKTLAILGAGPIGCEMATVFARLGTRVHLFDVADRVLQIEIPEASARVAAALQGLGVTLHLGEPVKEVRSGTDKVVLSGDREVHADHLLVALGRKPNTANLQLGNAEVATDADGYVQVDRRLRTTNKHIFAAGDCIAGPHFTHVADAHARILVQNALFAPSARIDKLVIPHCTYTNPEVASVGASLALLAQRKIETDRYVFDFADLDRGRTEVDGGGFVQVFTKRGTDTIVHATVVGHDAGEQIAPLCLAMSNGLGLASIGRSIVAYPTRAEYLKRLADDYNRRRLTPTVAKLFRGWLNFTG